MNMKSRLWRLGPVAILLLALLLSATVSTSAQGENLNGEPPEQEPEVVVLNETVLSPSAINTTIEIPISSDTYISSNNPNTNYGSSTWLRLGYNLDAPNNGAERIFLKASLSSIPQGAAINWAKFRIYQHTYTPGGDGSMGVQSRHLGEDWSESAVTWNNHQPNWGSVIATSWIPDSVGWMEADITQLVKDWVSGKHPNHGVMLMGDERVQERQRIFYSRESGGNYPRLIVDYTYNPDTQPPRVSVHALPQWSPNKFTVSWSGDDPGGSGIDYYDVQYRAGGAWVNWLNATKSTSAEFVGGANGVTYEFRARGVDKAGNIQPYPDQSQAWTRVDNVAPTASVNPLPEFTSTQSFMVTWGGSDNAGGSGIKHFDVEYRKLTLTDTGAWQSLLSQTTQTSFLFTGGTDLAGYQFRARATDNVGNVQPFSEDAQAETVVMLTPLSIVLPFDPPILKHTDPVTDSFTVTWFGITVPDTTITNFEVRYRFNGGSWQTWLNTADWSAVFDLPPAGTLTGPDGKYEFEVAATNSLGQKEAFTGIPEAYIIIDRLPPYITPKLYLPNVFTDID